MITPSPSLTGYSLVVSVCADWLSRMKMELKFIDSSRVSRVAPAGPCLVPGKSGMSGLTVPVVLQFERGEL